MTCNPELPLKWREPIKGICLEISTSHRNTANLTWSIRPVHVIELVRETATPYSKHQTPVISLL
jgi:hypothetical protein